MCTNSAATSLLGVLPLELAARPRAHQLHVALGPLQCARHRLGVRHLDPRALVRVAHRPQRRHALRCAERHVDPRHPRAVPARCAQRLAAHRGDTLHQRQQLRAAHALLGGYAQSCEHRGRAVPAALRHHPDAGVPVGVLFVAGVVVPARRCRGQIPREALRVTARDLVCRLHPSASVPVVFTFAVAPAEIGHSAWLRASHRITLNIRHPLGAYSLLRLVVALGRFSRWALWGPWFVLRLVAFSARWRVRDARCSRHSAGAFWGAFGRVCRCVVRLFFASLGVRATPAARTGEGEPARRCSRAGGPPDACHASRSSSGESSRCGVPGGRAAWHRRYQEIVSCHHSWDSATTPDYDGVVSEVPDPLRRLNVLFEAIRIGQS